MHRGSERSPALWIMHYKVSIVLVDETITKSAERRGRGGGGRQERWVFAAAGHRPRVKQARIEITRRLMGDNAGPALVPPGGAPAAAAPLPRPAPATRPLPPPPHAVSPPAPPWGRGCRGAASPPRPPRPGDRWAVRCPPCRVGSPGRGRGSGWPGVCPVRPTGPSPPAGPGVGAEAGACAAAGEGRCYRESPSPGQFWCCCFIFIFLIPKCP